MKKILVVGAGLSGATVARVLADRGDFEITVIDKKSHLAGNCYDYVSQEGIRIHKYGPHLFHTNNQKIFNWLSRFTEWIEYRHKVKAMLASGELVVIPVNRETADKVGRKNIIDIFFRPYTEKMWGVPLERVNPDILSRVKVRNDSNELYFPDDQWQALPKEGYTTLVRNILTHSRISVRLNTPYENDLERRFDYIFNSMPIDEYFNFSLGELGYRSIKFHTIKLPMPHVIPTATVNFTHSGPYTRVTEWNNLPNSPKFGESIFNSIITIEEPVDWSVGLDPMYPMGGVDFKYRELYQRYSKRTPKNMVFIGRCGRYQYLDMDDAIFEAMRVVNELF